MPQHAPCSSRPWRRPARRSRSHPAWARKPRGIGCRTPKAAKSAGPCRSGPRRGRRRYAPLCRPSGRAPGDAPVRRPRPALRAERLRRGRAEVAVPRLAGGPRAPKAHDEDVRRRIARYIPPEASADPKEHTARVVREQREDREEAGRSPRSPRYRTETCGTAEDRAGSARSPCCRRPGRKSGRRPTNVGASGSTPERAHGTADIPPGVAR